MNYLSYKSKKRILHAGIFMALGTSICYTSSVSAMDSVTPNNHQLNSIVVTANRTEQLAKIVPQAVETIDQEKIHTFSATDVRQALRMADNISVTKAGMTGNQVMIRGLDTRHTLLLVDGKRIAGEDSGSTTNVYALNRNNIDIIDRIEIVRGPSSSLYGSDAMGGVINIITKIPHTEQTRFNISTGSDNQNLAFGYTTGKVGPWQLSFNTRLTNVRPQKHDASGEVEEAHGPMKTIKVFEGYDQHYFGQQRYYNLDLIYDLQNTNKNKLRVGYNYFTERMKTTFADVKTKSTNKYSKKNYANIFHNNGYSFDVTYTGKTKNNDYQIQTYFNQMDKETKYTNDIEKDIFYPNDIDYANYYTWALEGKNTSYVNDKHTITAGGNIQTSTYKGTRVSKIRGLLKKHTITTLAAYIEDMWHINSKLFVTPSVRFDYNSQFGSNATSKLGITYTITPHTRFKANYGYGYKAPSISELYMNWDHGFVTILGNENLNPEKSRSFDFSIEEDRGKSFGKITYYNNLITNLIAAQPDSSSAHPSTGMPHGAPSHSSSAPVSSPAVMPHVTPNQPSSPARPPMRRPHLVYQYQNIEKAQINGLEFMVGRHLNPHWTIKFTHNFIDAINKNTHERLDNRVRHLTKIMLEYDNLKKQGTHAVLWNEIYSNYIYNNNQYSYNTLNLSVYKKFNTNFSMYAGIDNILNKKVKDIYLDGYQWNIGAEWKF